MRNILDFLGSYLGDDGNSLIFFAGLAILWLLVLPLVLRGVRMVVMWALGRSRGGDIGVYLHSRVENSLWMVGLGFFLLLGAPVVATEHIEAIYFRIAATFMIVAGVMFALIVIEHLFLQKISDRTTLPLHWCDKILFGVMVFFGVTIVLDYWGLAIAPILGGFGLLGIAVGLGAQDMFSNLIAGILIILEKRLAEGDVIEVGTILGTVKKIGLRSTLLEQFDMTPCYVPNAMIAGAVTSNHTRRLHRRIIWTLGLEYTTSAKQLRATRADILHYLENSEDFLPASEATCMVHLSEFADSSVNIYIHCFAKTPDFNDWMRVKEDLLLVIKEIVEKHGASFAFPSMTIYRGDGSASSKIS